MLKRKEKKEMLADGLSPRRRQEFFLAQQRKPSNSRSLDDYMAFLMAVQMIKPFDHKRVITPTSKNIL